MHDQELIYLVNECHNKQAFQILYSKYFEATSLMGQWKVFKTFYNLPLEKDDLITEAYFSFLKAIKTFDYKNSKLTFSKFFFLILRNNFFGLAKRYLQNKNKVMNDYISFDKFQKLDFLNSIKDSFDIEQELIKDLLKQEVIQKIMKMKQKNPKQHLYYSTILLRLEGYTSQEISRKLNVSEKFVWNKYYSFIKKIKDEKIFN